MQRSVTELMRRKSLLIVEANRLKSMRDEGGARAAYAEAAAIESLIAQELRDQGDRDFYINAVSAASCWIEARRYDAAAGVLRELSDAKLPTAVEAHIWQVLDEVRRQENAPEKATESR